LALIGCSAAGVSSVPTNEPVSNARPAAITVHATKVAAESTRPHPSVSHTWLDFREHRSAHAEQLAAPLLACARAEAGERSPDCNRRMETFEIPYALTALYRVTKDLRYAKAAERTIMRERVERHPRFDMYSASWFLALAREREVAMHNSDLRKEADAVAARLESALNDLDDFEFAQRALFGSDDNVAFVLTNLWGWADHRADAAMTQRLVSYTRSRMLADDMDSWCPMPVDGKPQNFEFMPPCLQRATTVLAVMPEQISNAWIREFVAAQHELEPIRHPRLTEHGVLNFARGWGLWSLYEATGDGRYRDMYVEHMNAQLGELERRGESASMDPWYSAFGVRALVQSYG